MACVELLVLLLCAPLLSPAAATPVWCFARLEEEGGGGACTELLGDEPVSLADCCLNPTYGYKLRPHGHCHTCRQDTWGPWGRWTSCSVTCGEGTQRRGRSRSPTGDKDPREWQLRACHLPCCPVAGGWTPWSPWSGCSVTCGVGTLRRSRACADPPPRCGGGCGPGAAEESRVCQGATPTCPVGGSWGSWGPWGSCRGTCSGAGRAPGRSRSRRCDSPPPSVEPPGAACAGAAVDTQPCPGLPPCPEDGAWGAWSATAPCPVTCGLGVVTQRRACDAPPPRHGGRGCHGNSTRRVVCGPHGACPGVEHWGPWGAWTPCERRQFGSISCQPAVGQQRRTRECLRHRPGGPPCPTDGGPSIIQLRTCYNIQNCLLPGNWSDWSPWGLCTPPCGASPTRSRVRECQPIYPTYPRIVTSVGSSTPVNVTFWGSARPRCPPLEGQHLRLEETRPCLHVLPCPAPHED
ncbi:properdin [Falco rusticolus]|uniref:properdin n=1 Tax=Falco rusticolus TaxID=120794 RepID=UPI0018866CA0|nr:properdin [Falco rusticolus]XP_055553673.1 properdin [Falco cherrug]